LRYNTLETELSDIIIYDSDAAGGHFLIMLQPPEKAKTKDILPKEMVFVVDDSGSMSGWHIMKAKETMKHCITRMNDDDTFQMYSFSDRMIKLFETSKPNNRDNLDVALRFLGELNGRGGTEMLPAIVQALSPPYDIDRLRIVCFMTDGGISNEFEILDAIRKNAQYSRFFAFGIGNSSNRYLIDKMADEGRGEVQFVTTEEDSGTAAAKFYDAIANPILSDIKIEFNGIKAEQVFPEKVKDLYSSKPVVICGRFRKAVKGNIVLTGKVGGKAFRRSTPVDFLQKMSNDRIAKFWARKKIDHLMAQDYLVHQYRRGMNIGRVIE
jgi:Ca-activated chloride channel family protein